MASVRALAQQRYDARDRRMANRSRYRPLQLAVWRAGDDVLDDEAAIRVGGKWDMTGRRYVGGAEHEVRIQLTRSQSDAIEPLILWLHKHLEQRELVAEGATWDEAIEQVWQDRQSWYRWLWYGGRRGGKTWLACLATCLYAIMIPGVRVVMMSPTQDDTAELRTTILGQMLAAEWRDWRSADQTIELIGERRFARQCFFNPELNDKMSHEALRAAGEGMSEQEYPREILGDMTVPIGDMVLSSWSSDNVIERVPISWRKRDVTREVVERFFGASGVALVGQHEDRFGVTLGEVTDAYGNKLFPSTDSTLLVADASSRWQSTEHIHDPEDRPSWVRLASQPETLGPALPDRDTEVAMAGRPHYSPRRSWRNR